MIIELSERLLFVGIDAFVNREHRIGTHLGIGLGQHKDESHFYQNGTKRYKIIG